MLDFLIALLSYSLPIMILIVIIMISQWLGDRLFGDDSTEGRLPSLSVSFYQYLLKSNMREQRKNRKIEHTSHYDALVDAEWEAYYSERLEEHSNEGIEEAYELADFVDYRRDAH